MDGERRGIVVDVVGLTVGTVVLRIPAFVASTHLTFDDGVYGASAVAMRAGGKPFAEVFSSQGPLWLPLVWLGDLAGFRTQNSPRVIAVVAGVVLALATYAAGRVVADRAGALLAAGLVTTSIGLLGVTGPVAADGAALALATTGVALALAWREKPSVAHAVAIGVAIGAGLSVKSLVVAALVPVALVLLGWRRPKLVAVAAAATLGFHLAVALPWGLGDVWYQSYEYHLMVAGDRTPIANLGKAAATLGDRELPLVVAAALAALLGRTRRIGTPDKLLLAWFGAMLFVILVEHPLWRPHVAHLVPPAALLVARHRPPTKALALAALAVVPYHLVHADYLLRPDPYRGHTAAVVERLRQLPPGVLAISDDPGVVWRAGRRTTDDLVDASVLRIEVGDMTAATVAEAAATRGVCAVDVRSSARWGSFDDLPERLADAGYAPAIDDGHGRVLYLRDPCPLAAVTVDSR